MPIPLRLRTVLHLTLAALAPLRALAAGPTAPAAPVTPDAASPAASNRPLNVLFIVVEDLSLRLGCYGDPYARTPNLDAFSKTAVRFTNCHTNPQCSPSRTALLSGFRPDVSGAYGNGHDESAAAAVARRYLPLAFKDAGYDMIKLGKLGHPDRNGVWQTPNLKTLLADLPDPRPQKEPSRVKPDQPESVSNAAWGPTGTDDLETGDGRSAEAAARLLAQPREKPFFLSVGLFMPHLPYRAPQKYFDLFPPGSIPLPQNDGAGPDGLPTPETLAALPGRGYQVWNSIVGDWNPRTVEDWKAAAAAHYACISFMDAQVGRILAGLEASGHADDTVVVFWTDHGQQLGEQWRWRKGHARDLSTRCVLMMRAPGVSRSGGVCDGMVAPMDFFPTLFDLCGINAPDRGSGRSLVDQLRDPTTPAADGILTWIERNQLSYVTPRWRYNEAWPTKQKSEAALPPDELFDRQADPAENHNLINDPALADTVAQLRAAVTALRTFPPHP